MQTPREIRFSELSGAVAFSGVFADLDRRYREPHRHYHGWGHIDRLIDLLDTHLDECFDRVAVELAIWFHDAIYLPANPNNEIESARLLRAQAHRLNIEPRRIEDAATMIHATRPQSSRLDGETDHSDTRLLQDLDLSILGSDAATYSKYAEAIALEYSTLPPDKFASGRIRILEKFLQRTRIYSIERFVTAYEERARANLAREIEVLRSRLL